MVVFEWVYTLEEGVGGDNYKTAVGGLGQLFQARDAIVFGADGCPKFDGHGRDNKRRRKGVVTGAGNPFCDRALIK